MISLPSGRWREKGVLLERPKGDNLGTAVTAAMDAVENHFPPLAGQLPNDYERFEDDMDLEELNEETATLAARIARNFEELGV